MKTLLRIIGDALYGIMMFTILVPIVGALTVGILIACFAGPAYLFGLTDHGQIALSGLAALFVIFAALMGIILRDTERH